MTDFVVTASKLNFRDAPLNGKVIAVLPRGQVLAGAAVAGNPNWLKVATALPQGDDDTEGFVAAQFAAPLDQPAGPPPKGVAGLLDMAGMQRFAPNGKAAILQGVVDEFAVSGAGFGLTKSKLILCHFLAQACHESAGFRTTREFWGPTKAQRGYEGRKDLGNTMPGDGKRFMGRGIFQLTGRANYRTFGAKLGLDLEDNPELAAEPRTSFLIACHYWATRGLEKWAVADNIREVTRRINGGHNGLSDRIALFNRAIAIF